MLNGEKNVSVVMIWAQRTTLSITTLIAKNSASLYIWWPLVLSALTYFFALDRKFFVVGGYCCIALALFTELRVHMLGAINNTMLAMFAAYVFIITCSILTFSSDVWLPFWFLSAYVLLPFLIGMNFRKMSRRSLRINFALLAVTIIFVFIENLFNGVGYRPNVFGAQGNSIPLSLVSAFVLPFLLFDSRKLGASYLNRAIFIFFLGFFSGGILPRWFLAASTLILPLIFLLPSSKEDRFASVAFFFLGWFLMILFSDVRAEFYLEPLGPRFAEIDQSTRIPLTSLEERIRSVLISIDLSSNHFLFGVGARNFGAASGGSVDYFPHISVLHALAELGIFTMILYTVMILYGGILLFRIAMGDSSYFPILVIFLYAIGFSMLHGNYLTDKLVYFALGIAASHGLSLKWYSYPMDHSHCKDD